MTSLIIRTSSSPSASRGGIRSRRTGSPPWIASFSLRNDSFIGSPQTNAFRDRGQAQAVRRQHVAVPAVAVYELVLQRERVEPTARPNVPGDLLGLRCQAALRHMLFDDDGVLMFAQGGGDTLAVERL